MVWVITVVCLTLSCEPIPIMAGYFFSYEDCGIAARLVIESWQPELGYYSVECLTRLQI